MFETAIKRRVFSGLLIVILALPTLSCADGGAYRDGGHFYHYRDRPHFGLKVSHLPEHCYLVRLGASRYYYYDGLYYKKRGRDYTIISPPIGAVVYAIPSDFQPVIIKGIFYYADNGIYYVNKGDGFKGVPNPETVTAMYKGWYRN